MGSVVGCMVVTGLAIIIPVRNILFTIKLLRSQLANLIESFLIALSQPTTPRHRAQPPFIQWQGNAKVDSSGKVTRLPEFLITMPDWQLLRVRRAARIYEMSIKYI